MHLESYPSTSTASLVSSLEESSITAHLSDVMTLYHDETDPEVFALRYQEIADRYPTLARSGHLFLEIKKH